MATRTPETSTDDVDNDGGSVDVPSDREYVDEQAGELDAALMSAIEAAEAAGKKQLATRLRAELGSHYYEETLGL